MSAVGGCAVHSVSLAPELGLVIRTHTRFGGSAAARLLLMSVQNLAVVVCFVLRNVT
jgi:hypothetical protein